MCTVKQRILENLLLTHYLHRVTGDLEPTYCTIGMTEETSGVEETLVEEPFSSQENDAFKQLHKIATSIDANNNNKKMTTASPLAQGKKHLAISSLLTTFFSAYFHWLAMQVTAAPPPLPPPPPPAPPPPFLTLGLCFHLVRILFFCLLGLVAQRYTLPLVSQARNAGKG